jgi:hypothetical protein
MDIGASSGSLYSRGCWGYEICTGKKRKIKQQTTLLQTTQRNQMSQHQLDDEGKKKKGKRTKRA